MFASDPPRLASPGKSHPNRLPDGQARSWPLIANPNTSRDLQRASRHTRCSVNSYAAPSLAAGALASAALGRGSQHAAKALGGSRGFTFGRACPGRDFLGTDDWDQHWRRLTHLPTTKAFGRVFKRRAGYLRKTHGLGKGKRIRPCDHRQAPRLFARSRTEDTGAPATIGSVTSSTVLAQEPSQLGDDAAINAHQAAIAVPRQMIRTAPSAESVDASKRAAREYASRARSSPFTRLRS
jgi:hypothetical protein